MTPNGMLIAPVALSPARCEPAAAVDDPIAPAGACVPAADDGARPAVRALSHWAGLAAGEPDDDTTDFDDEEEGDDEENDEDEESDEDDEEEDDDWDEEDDEEEESEQEDAGDDEDEDDLDDDEDEDDEDEPLQASIA